MRLVLRCDLDEKKVEIDVLPDDTFETLSNRLVEQENFSVNLKQLISATKPFEMTANVIEYYFKSLRNQKESDFPKPESPKPDEGSPEHILPHMSSELLSGPFTELTADEKTAIGDGDALDPLDEHVGLKSEPHLDPQMVESDIVPRKRLSVKYCRLCACTIEEDAVFIFQSTPTEPGKNDEDDEGIDTLADKINEALPILVSKEDELPKQVCLSCVECLNASHAFTRRVTAADDLLKNLLYQSNEFEKTREQVGDARARGA
ncbi:uncharacterized protein LOC120355202 [Nilaparvata lugens]|uniref:uncharacterized protein LOC120355202 n=1 Tax=Nilaparvata lugens TaxID=108931 RepID=UPI00193DC656|nr:uncharacterized protein LOC120355202 [Nilaparvata lugens]